MVTVKFIGVLTQLLSVARTEISPVISAPVVLVGAFHEGISPVPLAAIPMAVFVLVQSKVAPEGVLEKEPILMASPGHTPTFVIKEMAGVGLMVMLKVTGAPRQEFNSGVT